MAVTSAVGTTSDRDKLIPVPLLFKALNIGSPPPSYSEPVQWWRRILRVSVPRILHLITTVLEPQNQGYELKVTNTWLRIYRVFIVLTLLVNFCGVKISSEEICWKLLFRLDHGSKTGGNRWKVTRRDMFFSVWNLSEDVSQPDICSDSFVFKSFIKISYWYVQWPIRRTRSHFFYLWYEKTTWNFAKSAPLCFL